MVKYKLRCRKGKYFFLYKEAIIIEEGYNQCFQLKHGLDNIIIWSYREGKTKNKNKLNSPILRCSVD